MVRVYSKKNHFPADVLLDYAKGLYRLFSLTVWKFWVVSPLCKVVQPIQFTDLVFGSICWPVWVCRITNFGTFPCCLGRGIFTLTLMSKLELLLYGPDRSRWLIDIKQEEDFKLKWFLCNIKKPRIGLGKDFRIGDSITCHKIVALNQEGESRSLV